MPDDKVVFLDAQEPHFTNLLKGRKTVEGRLNKGRLSSLTEGSLIIFSCPEKMRGCFRFSVEVENVTRYLNFKKYLEQEVVENCLPGITSVEEGVKVYRRFYSEEKEKEHGVLALKIKNPKEISASS